MNSVIAKSTKIFTETDSTIILDKELDIVIKGKMISFPKYKDEREYEVAF